MYGTADGDTFFRAISCQIYGENSYYASQVWQCVSLIAYLQGIFSLQNEEINNTFSSSGERKHRYLIHFPEVIIFTLCQQTVTLSNF